MIRTRTAATLSAVVIAGLIVLLEWGIPVANDQFTVFAYQNKQYKIFRYGFPFTIIDANPILPQTTPQKEVWVRLAGNFMFFGVPIALLFFRRASRYREKRPNQAL
jgi:hypothetical protein